MSFRTIYSSTGDIYSYGPKHTCFLAQKSIDPV